jgi:hypothetical protein
MFAALALATYMVQPGDTLSGIAASHGVPLSAVESANPQISDPNVISVGESVSLTGGSDSAPAPAPSSPSGISSAHIISGDSSTGSSGGGGLGDVPGVPSSFAQCVAFHESTDGQNQAYNGGVYGIITASGINVNGQSVGAQKQAFEHLYQQYGTSPWAGDGCA